MPGKIYLYIFICWWRNPRKPTGNFFPVSVGAWALWVCFAQIFVKLFFGRTNNFFGRPHESSGRSDYFVLFNKEKKCNRREKIM